MAELGALGPQVFTVGSPWRHLDRDPFGDCQTIPLEDGTKEIVTPWKKVGSGWCVSNTMPGRLITVSTFLDVPDQGGKPNPDLVQVRAEAVLAASLPQPL